MRGNNLIILGVAIVLGAIAAVLARNWLANHARSSQSDVGTIVVASTPLTFGTQLTAGNTTEIPWSTAVLPEGAFATKQALLKDGRRMALALIARNEPILRSKITSPNQPATLSSMLTPGKRAVTVRVDDVRGVAGFIQPEDLVDVVLIRTEAESRSNDSYSEVILQSAKVLAIDQITGERTEQPTIAKAVTLEVSVEDAQKILLATNIGRLSLILRQPAGAPNDQVRRITERDLGNAPPEHKLAAELPAAAAPVVQAPAPAPARPAPRPPVAETKQITIWHGMKPQEYDRPLYGEQPVAIDGGRPADGIE
jgi:pilus assembly protein CpaB